MCSPEQHSLFEKYGIDPSKLPPGWNDFISLRPDPAPTVPAERPPIERHQDEGAIRRAQAPLSEAPTAPFQAAAPPTAQSLSEERVDKAAPQSLGGIAARFSVPTGKQGYSKSLRPEAGRLVR